MARGSLADIRDRDIEFEANLRARELRRHGAKVRLPDQSFQVLVILLERPTELVTREEIRKRLWPGDTFVDFDHGLNNAVNRLREALGDSAEAPLFIETLPRRGYRFIAPTNGARPESAVTTVEALSKQAEAQEIATETILVRGPDLPSIRSRLRLILAAPVILALILLIVYQIQKTPGSPSRRTSILPPVGTTLNLIGDTGGGVALSPDGLTLAFVAVNSQGKALIWVRPLGKLTADPIDGTEGATFPFWSPDGRWLAYFADGKLKKIRLEGGPAVTLCEAIFGRGGSWNSRGVIVFAPTSHSGIYRVPDTGGVPTPITTVDTSLHTTHRWPKFLPDGQHFIYLAANHFHDASHNGVYLGSLGGKENRFIVSADADAAYASGYLFFLRKDLFVAQRFDFKSGLLQGEPRPTPERVLYDPIIWKAVFDASEQGVMAYQLGDRVRGNQFRWFDRAGKQVGVLGEPSFQWEPSISRDGRKLVVGIGDGGYSHLWVYDLTRGTRMQITFSKFDNGSPIWSADGTRVLFSGKRQHYSLYQVDSRGTEPEHVILDTGRDIWPLDVSQDGRFLLYGQGLNIGRAQSQLWVYPLNGNLLPFRLLEGDAVESDAQFSPNERWVAYTSNESGRLETYVVPFDTTSNLDQARNAALGRKWQISISGGRWPRWRRDGRELFYMASDNTLMLAPVLSHGSVFRIGTPHPLFRINPGNYNTSYDVSPDGSRFIVNTAPEERAAPITLVEDWLSDFNK